MKAVERRRWINGGLLILAGGLAALALLDSGREPPPLLMKKSSAPIVRITVTRPGQPTLVFARQEGRWRMITPDSGWANAVLINRVLEATTLRCPRQYPAADLDLPALRLDPSLLQLRLDDQEIHFGVTTPTDGLRYLQTGATVHLCPDPLYRLLTSAAASFLAPPLKTIESSPAPSE
ncbi:MAG: hypothetical protein KDI50_03825 [Candidatus Competibacteraceae bacterium]|nr:hypothetical protein [Candidatus Competibacteraceae bacterium]